MTQTPPSRAHDQTHRRIFSHPQIIQLLLEGFVEAAIVAELDLTQLEQMKDTFVSQGLSVRESDMIWRVKRRDAAAPPLFVCVLLEFQSSVDWTMPIRISQYLSLLYEHIARQDPAISAAHQLPPVLPIVLYNGRARWHTPTELRDLIALSPTAALSMYQPSLQFLLIDEGRFTAAQLDQVGSILAQMFKLERLDDLEALAIEADRFIQQLRQILRQEAREDLARWLSELIKRFEIDVPLEPILAYKELAPMLTDAFERFKQEHRDKGLEQGLERGREVGLLQGERLLLGKLLTLKFGGSEGRAGWLDGLTQAQLERAAELLLSASDEQTLRATIDAMHEAP